jgi:hypothetical protein
MWKARDTRNSRIPIAACKFGGLQGLRKSLKEKKLWLQRFDLNQRQPTDK